MKKKISLCGLKNYWPLANLPVEQNCCQLRVCFQLKELFQMVPATEFPSDINPGLIPFGVIRGFLSFFRRWCQTFRPSSLLFHALVFRHFLLLTVDRAASSTYVPTQEEFIWITVTIGKDRKPWQRIQEGRKKITKCRNRSEKGVLCQYWVVF